MRTHHNGACAVCRPERCGIAREEQEVLRRIVHDAYRGSAYRRARQCLANLHEEAVLLRSVFDQCALRTPVVRSKVQIALSTSSCMPVVNVNEFGTACGVAPGAAGAEDSARRAG